MLRAATIRVAPGLYSQDPHGKCPIVVNPLSPRIGICGNVVDIVAWPTRHIAAGAMLTATNPSCLPEYESVNLLAQNAEEGIVTSRVSYYSDAADNVLPAVDFAHLDLDRTVASLEFTVASNIVKDKRDTRYHATESTARAWFLQRMFRPRSRNVTDLSWFAVVRLLGQDGKVLNFCFDRLFLRSSDASRRNTVRRNGLQHCIFQVNAGSMLTRSCVEADSNQRVHFPSPRARASHTHRTAQWQNVPTTCNPQVYLSLSSLLRAASVRSLDATNANYQQTSTELEQHKVQVPVGSRVAPTSEFPFRLSGALCWVQQPKSLGFPLLPSLPLGYLHATWSRHGTQHGHQSGEFRHRYVVGVVTAFNHHRRHCDAGTTSTNVGVWF